MHWSGPWRKPCSGFACWADRGAIAPHVSTVGKRSGARMSEGEGRAPPSLHLNRSAARAGKAGTAIGRIDNAPSKSNAPVRVIRGAPSSSTAYRAEHWGALVPVCRGDASRRLVAPLHLILRRCLPAVPPMPKLRWPVEPSTRFRCHECLSSQVPMNLDQGDRNISEFIPSALRRQHRSTDSET